MDDLIVVMCTFPSEDVVRQIGTKLIEKQLIACINCIPSVISLYQWEGAICEEKECLALLKTTRKNYTTLEQMIRKLHPYEVPEIIAMETDQVEKHYLAWVKGNTLD